MSKEVKEIKVDVITEEMIQEAKEAGKKVVRGRVGTKNEGFVKIDGVQFLIVDEIPKEVEKEIKEEKEAPKEKQVHESRDRDIKIASAKVGDIGVKIIYHRDSKGEKQFRIYLAQKIDGKLKRIRFQNEDLKKVDRDEKKSLEIYERIISGKIQIKVA